MITLAEMVFRYRFIRKTFPGAESYPQRPRYYRDTTFQKRNAEAHMLGRHVSLLKDKSGNLTRTVGPRFTLSESTIPLLACEAIEAERLIWC